MERNRVRIGDVGMRHNVAEQLTNMEAELNPITRAKLPERVTELEKDIFGASKAPRLEHDL